MNVLILGGYGTFGGRLAELLRDEERLTLIIAGRSRSAAQLFAETLGGKAKAVAQVFDRATDPYAQLAAIRPDVLVDASGPFQVYGSDRYRVVEAAVALGIHYLDLADGSEFVEGISKYDAEAKAKNVIVLSGVSSFPVLTSAVMQELKKRMRQIETVRGGIAPSPFAGVGLNVIRAIASYTGKPLQVMRNGKWQAGYGLIETMRYTIGPPGRLPLHNIHFSLVDVPDLKALPQLWPELKSVWMGAGPVPAILHRALNVLAWIVRLKIFPSALPFAGFMSKVINTLRWGEDRGGMFIEAQGQDQQGRQTKLSWHLLAEKKAGPMIPSMACEAIIRAMLDGRPPTVGARTAALALTLQDYERLFSRRNIETGIREFREGEEVQSIFREILGSAWDVLPLSLQTLHGAETRMAVSGKAKVERGKGVIAKIVCAIFGFPAEGDSVPVRVEISRSPRTEHWKRTFAGRSFRSRLRIGEERTSHLLCERFGPVEAQIALVLESQKLKWIVRGWQVFGIPLPRVLAPGGNSYEFEQDGRFHFHVEITLPFIGLVVRYQGELAPDAVNQAQQ